MGPAMSYWPKLSNATSELRQAPRCLASRKDNINMQDVDIHGRLIGAVVIGSQALSRYSKPRYCSFIFESV